MPDEHAPAARALPPILDDVPLRGGVKFALSHGVALPKMGRDANVPTPALLNVNALIKFDAKLSFEC
ncbi:hypothetical protein PCAR4_40275 [Paraburkholderia caribensis]|nr:hypothetical protein PCAR4_40275 [Paraburkholderia caribensis]